MIIQLYKDTNIKYIIYVLRIYHIYTPIIKFMYSEYNIYGIILKYL